MKKTLILLFLLQLIVTSTYAKNYNALDKLTRGAANIVLSGAEIPRQMIRTKEKHTQVAGDVAGFFLGFPKGLCCMAGRIVLGVYEVVTFAVPTYKPLVEPEYVFSDDPEEQRERRERMEY
jgi:putative exosortase-associated protein (TIGR04073 family)